MITTSKRKLLSEPKRLGQWGEKRCEKHLKKQGLKTLTRNYTCKTGELDLVMADADGTVVFVEVKTRKDEVFAPAEDVITESKKRKLCRTAKYFLRVQKIENRPCRFDIVTVTLDANNQEIIKHYPNAFVP